MNVDPSDLTSWSHSFRGLIPNKRHRARDSPKRPTQPVDSEHLKDNLRYFENGARYDVRLYDSLLRSRFLQLSKSMTRNEFERRSKIL